MASNDPAADMQDAADAAAREARHAVDATRETVQDAKDGAARAARDTAGMAQQETDARLREAAGRTAEEARRSAEAAHDAASDYPGGSLPNEALTRVSGFLEDTARSLRDTDLDQVTGEVRRFARSNPLTFVAGAAVVGFAAARLVRATQPDDPSEAGQGADAPFGAPSHATSRATSRPEGTADPQDGWAHEGSGPRDAPDPRSDAARRLDPVGTAFGRRDA